MNHKQNRVLRSCMPNCAIAWSKEILLRLCCALPFFAFFATFALLIYPNRSFLHHHRLVDNLANHLPAGFSAPLAIVSNWSFALFYVMAEMWGSLVTSLLFGVLPIGISDSLKSKLKVYTSTGSLHVYSLLNHLPLTPV